LPRLFTCGTLFRVDRWKIAIKSGTTESDADVPVPGEPAPTLGSASAPSKFDHIVVTMLNVMLIAALSWHSAFPGVMMR
jgi:hypothetical protein